MSKNISLYVHIPFCLRKCRYCDFYSLPLDNRALVDEYINALAREFEFYNESGVFENKIFKTLYVGGGTPSILTIDAWEKLCDTLFSKIDKSNVAEWSLECNPESFTIEKARAYATRGVTRLTFGIQSLNARELSLCARAHSAETALDVLSDERLHGMYNSIGADIIYGLPFQTLNTLDNTVCKILSVPHVKHLSAYELTVSENTSFGRHQKILNLPTDDIVSEMYYAINRRSAERGMRQYEVSNYALPHHESLHNKSYWSHNAYIGLGAGAHSYIYPKRWSNIADVSLYISKILRGQTNAVEFEETLSPAELSQEIIFLGLRNANGIDELAYKNITGFDFLTDKRKNILQRFESDGLLTHIDNKWLPTSKGMLFADMMAREA